MLCCCINPLMSQRLLRLANIVLGELRAHEAPEVMRFDMAEANLIRIPLHSALYIDGRQWHRGAVLHHHACLA